MGLQPAWCCVECQRAGKLQGKGTNPEKALKLQTVHPRASMFMWPIGVEVGVRVSNLWTWVLKVCERGPFVERDGYRGSEPRSLVPLCPLEPCCPGPGSPDCQDWGSMVADTAQSLNPHISPERTQPEPGARAGVTSTSSWPLHWSADSDLFALSSRMLSVLPRFWLHYSDVYLGLGFDLDPSLPLAAERHLPSSPTPLSTWFPVHCGNME